MATKTTLSRIGVDFFAILVPGAYVLTNALAVVAICTTDGTPIALAAMASDAIAERWPLALSLLLASYLTGQVLHALAVNRADDLSKEWFSRFQNRTWEVLLNKGGFPYRAALEATFDHVLQTQNTIPADVIPAAQKAKDATTGESEKANSSTQESDVAKIVFGVLHTTYNYWKAVLCVEEPSMFAFIQTREARVRLFAGMVWSGVAGVFIGFLMLIISLLMVAAASDWFYLAIAKVSWLHIGVAQVVVSSFIFSVFAYQFRRIRAQEVDSVFLGYLAHRQKVQRS